MRSLRNMAHWVLGLTRYQMTRYVVVGFLSHMVSFLVFALLTEGFGMWYIYATMISGTVAWTVNFPLHRGWTFDDRRGAGMTTLQGGGHYTLKLWNTYVLDPYLLYVLVESLGWAPLWAKAIAPFGIGLQNFVLCRYVIFRKPAL